MKLKLAELKIRASLKIQTTVYLKSFFVLAEELRDKPQ